MVGEMHEEGRGRPREGVEVHFLTVHVSLQIKNVGLYDSILLTFAN